jgi:hypothetical protein
MSSHQVQTTTFLLSTRATIGPLARLRQRRTLRVRSSAPFCRFYTFPDVCASHEQRSHLNLFPGSFGIYISEFRRERKAVVTYELARALYLWGRGDLNLALLLS